MTLALCNTSKTFLKAQPEAAMARFLAKSILIRTTMDGMEKVEGAEKVGQFRLIRFPNLPRWFYWELV